MPELTGYASIRHVAVSLPYAAHLIDGVKYMLPGDVKPPEGGTERRRQRAPRGPTLKSLVKLAVRCDSAEQLGMALKRRYGRRHPSRREIAETEARIDKATGEAGLTRCSSVSARSKRQPGILRRFAGEQVPCGVVCALPSARMRAAEGEASQ